MVWITDLDEKDSMTCLALSGMNREKAIVYLSSLVFLQKKRLKNENINHHRLF